MGKRYEMWIGRRYVRARSSNNFVSLISAISMLGIAIAVTVLIVVLSVVNGFERELQDRLLAMTAHANIEGLEELTTVTFSGQLDPALNGISMTVDGQSVTVGADRR